MSQTPSTFLRYPFTLLLTCILFLQITSFSCRVTTTTAVGTLNGLRANDANNNNNNNNNVLRASSIRTPPPSLRSSTLLSAASIETSSSSSPPSSNPTTPQLLVNNSTLLTRLLFTHATKLLQKSQDTTTGLELQDTYDLVPLDLKITEPSNFKGEVGCLEDDFRMLVGKKVRKQLGGLKKRSLFERVNPFSSIRSSATSSSTLPIKKKRENSFTTLTNSPLFMSILWHYRKNFLFSAVLRLSNTLTQMFPSLLLRELLRTLEGKATSAVSGVGKVIAREDRSLLFKYILPSHIGSLDIKDPYVLSTLLFFTLWFKTVLENCYFQSVSELALRVRGEVGQIIFDKSLTVSSSQTQPTTTASASRTTASSSSSSSSSSSTTATTSSNETNKQILESSTTVNLQNLITSDLSQIEGLISSIHTLWDAPLQILLLSSLLYHLLGPPAILGLFLLGFSVPFNRFVLGYLSERRNKMVGFRDLRINYFTQTLSTIQTQKLNHWTPNFVGKIEEYRESEQNENVKAGIMRALNSAVLGAMPSLVLVTTLAIYTSDFKFSFRGSRGLSAFMGYFMVGPGSSFHSGCIKSAMLAYKSGKFERSLNPLRPSIVFSAVSLFNQLRFPLLFYPMLLASIAQGGLGLKRVEGFMMRESEVAYVMHRTVDRGDMENEGLCSLVIRDGDFAFSQIAQPALSSSSSDGGDDALSPRSQSRAHSQSQSQSQLALHSINLSLHPGEMVSVIGPVGSGKTSLLRAIVDQLYPVPSLKESASSTNSTSTSASNDDERVVNSPFIGITTVIESESETQTTPTNSPPPPSPSLSPENFYHTTSPHGDIAYAPQQPWLSPGTLQETISFGLPFHLPTYTEVIVIAGLAHDLGYRYRYTHDYVTGTGTGTGTGPGAGAGAGAGAGTGTGVWEVDDSVVPVIKKGFRVNESGKNLSGGQRSRIALARTLYTLKVSGLQSKRVGGVLLLDDPLAALDARVKREVFENVKVMVKREGWTCVVSTNDPSVPGKCDRVLIMGHKDKEREKEKGSEESYGVCGNTILDQGSYWELIGRGHDLIGEKSLMFKQVDEGEEERNKENASPVNKGRREEEGEDKDGMILKAHGSGGEDGEDCESVTLKQQMSMSMPKSKGVENAMIPDLKLEDKKFAYLTATTTPTIEDDKSLDVQTLTRSNTAVPFSTYREYLSIVNSPKLLIAAIAMYLLSNSAQLYQQSSVASWTDVASSAASSASTSSPLRTYYLIRLVSAAFIVSLTQFLRAYFSMICGIKASSTLHSSMLTSVFNAPMSFFDRTPSGQLLTRFGREMEIVDRLSDQLSSVFICFLQIFMSSFAIAGSVNPAILIPMGFVFSYYFKFLSTFRPCARDLKRLESKSRSPIQTHFANALRGMDIIRTVPFAKKHWSENFGSLVDDNLSANYALKSIDRWLSIRLETLGDVIVLIAAFGASRTRLLSSPLSSSSGVNAGKAGWGLSQALAITGLLNWAVRVVTDSETQMMAFQRCLELSTASTVSRELSGAGEGLRDVGGVCASCDEALMQAGWPWKGEVEFRNVNARYAKSNGLVLDDVNIHVPAGTSVGIVGRTGSGKSSLLLALFRLLELEHAPGQTNEEYEFQGQKMLKALPQILIDGIDIRAVSLKNLRERITIIPQEPCLFPGSIRYNLNPSDFSVMSKSGSGGVGINSGASIAEINDDKRLWSALNIASPTLSAKIRRNGGLDTIINERTFSLGERQLLVLSRALLKNTKILCLDEASAAMDLHTDRMVQRVLRREFIDRGVTVITVAHRLQTVAGYDNVVVLGNGKVLEVGHPARNVRFREMIFGGGKVGVE